QGGEPMSDPAQALALPEALFAAIISATQGALYRFVCRLVNDSEQARDIVQDVFVEAVRAAQRQAPPFVSPSGPVSRPIDTDVRRWLFQVASHRAISFARHRRVLAWESLERLHAPESHRFYEPVPFEDRIAEGEVLHAALAQLTPEDVALVVLKEVEGFTI